MSRTGWPADGLDDGAGGAEPARSHGLNQRVGWLLTAAVVLGLVLRLGFALGYWVGKPFTVDQIEYMLLADNLVAGNGLVYGDGHRRLMRSPGYPVFLAGVYLVSHTVSAVKALQCLIGALSVLLVAALARRVAGRRSAVAAAFITAAYPPLIWMPAYILSETLYMFVALSAALLLWRALDLPLQHRDLSGAARSRRSSLRLAGAGAVTGAAILTRPEMLIFVGLLCVVLWARRRTAAAAIVLGGALLIVAPWSVYYSVTHDGFILVSARGGPNFWMGNNALSPGDGDTGATPSMGEAYNVLLRSRPDMNPAQTERLFYREAFAFIRGDPMAWMTNQARKVFYFWIPVGPSYRSRSPLYWIGQASSYALLLPFAVAGCARIVRRQPQPVILWLLALTTFLTCFIFFPVARYRIPVFDPVMIICASVLIDRQRVSTDPR